MPGVASVATGIVAIGTDKVDGGFLFTVGSGTTLQKGGALMSACAAQYSGIVPMASCGADCAVAAWFDFPKGCSNEYQPVYAFLSPEGCGLAGTFPAYTSTYPWPIAVASQPGSVAIAYGQNEGSGSAGTSTLQLEYCIP